MKSQVRLVAGKSLLSLLLFCFTFSFIFSQQKPITHNPDSETGIALTSDTVVNIGYGTQNKRDVTGSITTITSDEFNKGNINNPMQLIQGRVAGLDISKPGGDPNGPFYLRLRGLTTINCNTQPLIVVDGITGVPLNNVDPNDIESFTVLKDAAAASIYGIRGSNGVILVTTKKRTTDKPVVNYNVYASAENVARNLPAMNLQNGGHSQMRWVWVLISGIALTGLSR